MHFAALEVGKLGHIQYILWTRVEKKNPYFSCGKLEEGAQSGGLVCPKGVVEGCRKRDTKNPY